MAVATTAMLPSSAFSINPRSTRLSRFLIRCCSDSSPKRGFGNSQQSISKQPRKSSSKPSRTFLNQAPGLKSQNDGKLDNSVTDLDFEERLQAIRRSVLQQKKAEEEKEFGVIDYDAPIESSNDVGLGTKIGVGVAVLVFGLVFALGDFLPSGSISPSEEADAVKSRLSEDERVNLQKRREQFEATLRVSPEDPAALEGAAVTLAELGEYRQAASRLEDLSKKKPNDPDVSRLLGEVKYELKDYDGSITAFRSSAKKSKALDFEVLRGLTNSLLASNKPDEAVQVLVASRERLEKEKSDGVYDDNNKGEKEPTSQADPIQVDLLLGKAYSNWGRISDAVAVYDRIISSYPEDFRGYLAKGIILKENGNSGDAERMFIQARFFAPEKAKSFIDKYSR